MLFHAYYAQNYIHGSIVGANLNGVMGKKLQTDRQTDSFSDYETSQHKAELSSAVYQGS